MGIILKFIFTSIRERKFRTFLILFSISLSSALFFASNALSQTLQEMYVAVMKKYYGSSNVVIVKGKDSNWFLSTARAEKYLGRLEYVIGTIDGGGFYKPSRRESVSFSLRGFRMEELDVFSPWTLAEQGALYPFAGAKIVVNQIAAKQYGWKLGGSIDIEVTGAKRRFLVVGIALPLGVFQEGFDKNVTGVVPRDYLAGLYDIRGKATSVYLRARTAADIAPIIRELSREYPRYTVREPLDKAERERFVSNIQTPLLLMTIMVLFMSVFIIYSSFKVITVERMPSLGTFRSIGATRKTTDFLLILETFLYGAVGGACGCLLGIGILSIMTNLMAYNAWAGIRLKTELHFETMHMVLAFLVAVILSFASSLIPIIRVSKIPVKDIVLNRTERDARKRPLLVILGIAALVVTPVVPFIVPKSIAFPVDAVCLFLAMAALIVLVPFLTSLLVRLLQRLYQVLFGNEAVLAAKNLRENRNILNNISLLTLSISSLILIFTISFSAVRATIDFYADARFGLWAYIPQADRNTELILRSIKGVTAVNSSFVVDNVEIEKSTKRISILQGINTRTFLDFWDLKIPIVLLRRLDEGRTILLANVQKDMLGASLGDTVTLVLKNGKKAYTVIGFFDSVRNNGSFALVSEKYLKADADLRWFSDIYIKTDLPPNDTEAAFKTKLERRYPWISTIAQMRENNVKSNQQLLTLLEGFAVMTLVMGVFGILNNFIISFVERRRHLAIFRSVGMSRRQIVRMMFMESFTAGLISGLVGCAGGGLLLFLATYMLAAMNLYVTMTFSFPVFITCLAASIVISLIASISPALKSGRLNIIESIKYE
jgi:putative ABC transport system permease protein